MTFNDLEFGQKFRFKFEQYGDWVYIKKNNRLFSEASVPSFQRTDYRLTFDINDMDLQGNIEVVLA